MRQTLLVCLLLVGCASTTAPLSSRQTDLDLVTAVASSCVDSVVAAGEALQGEVVRIAVTGGGEGAWLVRTLLERAFLGRHILTDIAGDSAVSTVDVRIVELGVRHRGVDRRGVLRTPWVLREGSCILVARIVGPTGHVVASVHAASGRAEWTPGAEIAALAHPLFSPSGSVPTSPGLIAPAAVVATVAALLALFFVTSE